jgi:hypothetical protein
MSRRFSTSRPMMRSSPVKSACNRQGYVCPSKCAQMAKLMVGAAVVPQGQGLAQGHAGPWDLGEQAGPRPGSPPARWGPARRPRRSKRKRASKRDGGSWSGPTRE